MPPAKPPHALQQSRELTRTLIKGYIQLMVIGYALAPSVAVAYLYYFQNPSQRFVSHAFHETAIGIASLLSAFVTYVTWRCYQHSGEPFLRWLTRGFLGFTLIYAPLGLFTRLSDEHFWLFLLYGPVSRLVMMICLLVALLMYGQQADSLARRANNSYWWAWIAGFALFDVGVAAAALSPITATPLLRQALEGGSMFLAVAGIVILIARRIRSPLMTTFYVQSLAWFAQSSYAFAVALPWEHLWWLAHAIFAAGFFLLSYGVAQAFLATRAFSTVYSHEEWTGHLEAAKDRAEKALAKLQYANQQLERLAATDSLTGAANRREFLARTGAELARASRTGAPLCVLALDLDHFKAVNDRYGHQVGDEVLRASVEHIKAALRPSDVLGRTGGEEFMVLLPDVALDGARTTAERLRQVVEQMAVPFKHGYIQVTTSIGAAQFGRDGTTPSACFNVADQRLYRAKQAGRNRVVAG